jgi:hypothetical protein
VVGTSVIRQEHINRGQSTASQTAIQCIYPVVVEMKEHSCWEIQIEGTLLEYEIEKNPARAQTHAAELHHRCQVLYEC